MSATMLLTVSILVFILLVIGIALTIYEFHYYLLKKEFSYPKKKKTNHKIKINK